MNDAVFWLIPIVAIAGGVAAVIVVTVTRGRIRELEIRERIAMIERGLVPAPELDPRGFETAMDRVDQQDQRGRFNPGRHRRAGVVVMGVGFGTAVLVGFTSGQPEIAIGVGGFLVVIGFAIFLNGVFSRDARPAYPLYRPIQPPPAGGSPPAPPQAPRA